MIELNANVVFMLQIKHNLFTKHLTKVWSLIFNMPLINNLII